MSNVKSQFIWRVPFKSSMSFYKESIRLTNRAPELLRILALLSKGAKYNVYRGSDLRQLGIHRVRKK